MTRCIDLKASHFPISYIVLISFPFLCVILRKLARRNDLIGEEIFLNFEPLYIIQMILRNLYACLLNELVDSRVGLAYVVYLGHSLVDGRLISLRTLLHTL